VGNFEKRGGIFLVAALVLLVVFFAGCTEKPTATPAPTIPPKPVVYEGTVYVSGMGGHFSEAKIKIDPSNSAEPIEVISLDRIKLHKDINISKKIYGTHDPRIDLKRNILYWSAYVSDQGKVHVGAIDLGKKGKDKRKFDVTVDMDPGTIKPAVDVTTSKQMPMYCGSAQTEKYFMPVFMAYPGYIDLFDKDTMEHKSRVYLDHPDIPKVYTWTHGVNTPDGKNVMIWMGDSVSGGAFPREKPTYFLFLLDAAALERGELKILKKGTITGDPKKTAAFRGFFTNDGKYLLLSGRDRGYVIDAETLQVVDAEMMPEGWENHDIMPTPDDKYALFTLRVPIGEVDGKTIKDGQLQLYDMSKKALVGKPVSMCQTCHEEEEVEPHSAILCGQDATWKVNGKTTPSSAGLFLQ
jgi:hypothetical protein